MEYDDEYYNYNKHTSLKGLILFEIISWYGRYLKFRRTRIIPEKMRKPILIDLGAGANYQEGWTHADFFPFPRFKFWKRYSQNNRPELELDLRYPVKCPDNCVDGIYSGHTLEHLFPGEAICLLKEIFRMLKPSSYLRINVPDIEFAVDFYNGKNNLLPNSTGCEAISDICQNWGHRSAWDEELLTKTLKRIGFVDIRKVLYGTEGIDKRLIKEEKAREVGTLVLEAQKPIL
jgi:predicted SAM-dependent methyltransferase